MAQDDEKEALLAIFGRINDFEIGSYILHFDFSPDYPFSRPSISLKCPIIDIFNTAQQVSFEKDLLMEIDEILSNSL